MKRWVVFSLVVAIICTFAWAGKKRSPENTVDQIYKWSCGNSKLVPLRYDGTVNQNYRELYLFTTINGNKYTFPHALGPSVYMMQEGFWYLTRTDAVYLYVYVAGNEVKFDIVG